ncbi:MAG: hypothetical protein AAF541_17445 [Pseudomonadota bacterium]
MDDHSEIALITHSLERFAELVGDMVPPLYEAFFASDADALGLMGHSDEHMRGRMLESVLEILMTEEHLGAGKYLDWELDNHLDAYAVQPAMYSSFFLAMLEVTKTGLGAEWNEQHQAAWDGRIEKIINQVNEHKSVPSR